MKKDYSTGPPENYHERMLAEENEKRIEKTLNIFKGWRSEQLREITSHLKKNKEDSEKRVVNLIKQASLKAKYEETLGVEKKQSQGKYIGEIQIRYSVIPAGKGTQKRIQGKVEFGKTYYDFHRGLIDYDDKPSSQEEVFELVGKKLENLLAPFQLEVLRKEENTQILGIKPLNLIDFVRYRA